MELENGRFKCVETGHEMLAKDKESYSQSKRCRLGLIDFALAHNKPPPICSSKILCPVRNSSDKDSDSEEDDFWMPPVGDRWDFDNGGDRWGSGGESGQESEEENQADGKVEENGRESEELSRRTKRMSIEIGPGCFASRKKKSKK
ncbi:hypothetical protein GH714_009653 [Hevea brasiliensis]|uniref:Uncharacterized protein n=1 Tax=Hevea brasiliensis TaxID=3981 RepID=A0A6A6M7B1_HEVBR|nr:hypothetical protein GH714_009653 [Hevea brasiliensis]